jgi:flagellar basal body-associated protein FliL
LYVEVARLQRLVLLVLVLLVLVLLVLLVLVLVEVWCLARKAGSKGHTAGNTAPPPSALHIPCPLPSGNPASTHTASC